MNKDVEFELGLFKSNGVEITNKTGYCVIVIGNYSDDTTDKLDYNYHQLLRLAIEDNSHSGIVKISTFEDN